MKLLKHDIKLAEKYKAWKEHCARPYSRNRNAIDSNRENNKKIRQTLEQEGPLTSAICDLIPHKMKLELNKIWHVFK